MKPSITELSDLLLCFSETTINELIDCRKEALMILLAEGKIQRGFKATRLYFSNKAIQQFQHLSSENTEILERWVEN